MSDFNLLKRCQIKVRSNVMKTFIRFALFIFSISVFVGCGASTYTSERYELAPYSSEESKQTKDNITIERVPLNEIPEEFKALVQGCNASGQLLVKSGNEPHMVYEYALPRGGYLEKLHITNNTGHVIRLNNSVIVAFDPANNQYPIKTKEEIKALLQQERPCPSTSQLESRITTLKFFERNTELLPNMTTTGYIYYKPQDWRIPGTWKLSIFDFPVETEASGVVKKAITFEMRSVVKKYIDTYKVEFMKQPEKVSSEEVK
ncbi:MAG: hypothetical protein FD143_832 [Ignavibacteria bacterium]|nr:MAG: hypothetical protein FD143_832 [Ignavibacteria bacterium]KAF0160582.1 MAG: hypothetical protein FD188_1574 [Ignavibacteria bacterium]